MDHSVSQIEHCGSSRIGVRTENGKFFEGDLVVGADGVHSRVRREMWRLTDQPISQTDRDGELRVPNYEIHSADTISGMTVEYACVFGISNAVPGLRPGEQVTSFNEGRSFLVFPGVDERAFWFLLYKLDRVFPYHRAPRFSNADAERVCSLFSEDIIWRTLKFKDLWERRETFSVTGLEEHVFQTWHSGRVVCIGDSMHKVHLLWSPCGLVHYADTSRSSS